jgi:hypothetical protein
LEKENRTLSTESKKSLKEKLRLEDKVKELELKYNELLSKNQGLKNDSKSASDDSKEKLQKEVNNNSPKSALVTNTIQK